MLSIGLGELERWFFMENKPLGKEEIGQCGRCCGKELRSQDLETGQAENRETQKVKAPA
jgi:hypothetical protein